MKKNKQKMKVISTLLVALLLLNIPCLYVNAEESSEYNNEQISDGVTDKSDGLDNEEEHFSGPSIADNSDEVAEEFSNDVEENKDNTETEEIDNKQQIQSAQDSLEYIYVEQPEIRLGEVQNIVISFMESHTILGASLKYVSLDSGEEYTSEAAKIVKNTILFEIENNQLGTYCLKSMQYNVNSEVIIVDLSESNWAAEFQVINENPGKKSTDSNMEISTYAFDDEGKMVENAGENVAEVVNEAIEASDTDKDLNVETFSREEYDTKKKTLTIALDPGHDTHCGGASGNGLKEAELTLKVAQYCKRELEKYSNVEVILTRESAACPNPQNGSYTSAQDIRQRVQKAKQKGADIFVSFHFNSGGGKGAEIIYQNQSYDASIGLESKVLAEKIQRELVALGLYDRDIYSKDSTNNERDPNGILADYFTVHNESKEQGMPAIIIEHAFIDNSNEAALLKQESFLKKLGLADANGIVEAYNLITKEDADLFNQAKLEIKDVSGNKSDYEIKVTGLANSNRIKKVDLVVIGGKNGNQWFPAKKQNDGAWSYTLRSNEIEKGTSYTVDAYITLDNGKSVNLGEVPIDLYSKPKIGDISVKLISDNQYEVTVSGITSESGVERVDLPIWSEKGEIKWYETEQVKAGTYKTEFHVKDHGYAVGKYMIDVYAKDGNGVTSRIGGTTYSVAYLQSTVAVQFNEAKKDFTVKAENVATENGIKQVDFAVGNESGTHWFSAQKSGNSWSATANIGDLGSHGSYYADVYVTDSKGKSIRTGGENFEIEAPHITKISIGNENPGEGTFEVIIDGITSAGGIDLISIPVWIEKSGVIWFTATKKENGSYCAKIETSQFNNYQGKYFIDVYLRDKNNLTSRVDGTSYNFYPESRNISVKGINNQKQIELTAKNLENANKVKSVDFAVWCDGSGFRWYSTKKTGNNSWSTQFDVKDFSVCGTYYAEAYVKKNDNSTYSAGIGKVVIESATVEKVYIGEKDEFNGLYQVVIKGVTAKSGIESVDVPVWAEDGIVQWYPAVKKSDGSYAATFDVKKHNFKTGKYTADVYIKAKNGTTSRADGVVCNVEKQKVTVTANDGGNQKLFYVKTDSIAPASGIKRVDFAVWREGNGVKWYNAIEDSLQSWNTMIDIGDFRMTGKYFVHAYGIMHDGRSEYVGSTDFTVDEPTAAVSIPASNIIVNEGKFRVVVSNISSPSGIKEVHVPVWEEGRETKWYLAKKDTNGNYCVDIYVTDLEYTGKKITADVYIKDGNNIISRVGGASIQESFKCLTPIMGTSNTSVEKMVSDFWQFNTQYDKFVKYGTEYDGVLNKGGAENIAEFCKIIMEEAAAEGVRTEVVYAQIMLETGYLTFGGDVTPEQYNFAGMGATGGGVKGCVFSSVREGIRAQVQHLKCYASTEPLNNTNVDQRWNEALRNKARYVEWLAIPQNPNQAGWATDSQYGDNIVKIMKRI